MASTRTISSLSEIRHVPIDEARARAHVLRPANVRGLLSSKGPEDAVLLPRFEFPTVFGGLYYLDVAGFGNLVDAGLNGFVAGYVMQLRQRGHRVDTRERNWAKTPTDGSASWTSSVRMHIASCSKFITAIAITKLLHDKQMSPDTPIIGFLPDYWVKGPNIEKITFRQLLTHTSGFNTGLSDSDFEFMKKNVAAGVNTVGGPARYQNMNFGLCRIVIATILEDVLPHTLFNVLGIPNVNDVLWDYVTIQSYVQYVQRTVFAPASVSGPTLDHPDTDALSYKFPAVGTGWNSGDLTTASGGVGWHMSADDLLAIMATFRRAGTIMHPLHAQSMLDEGFGLDEPTSTPLGWMYVKGGYWGHADGNREQSLLYMLPRDMELVLLANSPVGSPEKNFPKIVVDAYQSSIQPAYSVRQYLQRKGLPISSSIHALVGPSRSVRKMLPA